MTATMPERPTLQDQIMTALEPVFADAHVFARFPCGLLRALLTTDEHTEDLTVRGIPVTITAAAGRMTPNEIAVTGDRVYALDLMAGAHIIVDGPGMVRVDRELVAS